VSPFNVVPDITLPKCYNFYNLTTVVLKNDINFVDKDVPSLASAHYKNSHMLSWTHFY